MISSLSSARQIDYFQKPATNKPDQNAAASSILGDKKTGELSEEQLKAVSDLKKRDTEVRAHEAAHLAAAGSIAQGGANFSYQQGPDGIRYAIGGEVNIDTSAVAGDPLATLRKADTIRRAALAPAQPSGPDLQAASNATSMAAKAQVELLQKNQDSQNGQKDRLGTELNLSA